MKCEMLQLVHLTQLYFYENYSIHKEKMPLDPPLKERTYLPPAPKIAPVKQKAKVEEKITPEPALTPIPTTQSAPSEFQKLFAEKLPHIKFVEKLPDDLKARSKGAEWLTVQKPLNALILAEHQNMKELQFLTGIALCLECYVGKAAVVSQTDLLKEIQGQHSVQLIVATEEAALRLKLPQEIPIVLLEPLTHYFKNPMLKASLFNSLLSHLK